MAETTNGTLIYRWIIGGMGAVLISSGFLVIERIGRDADRIGVLEQSVAKMSEHMLQLDKGIDVTHSEQISRTDRFADITNRLTVLEITSRMRDLRIDGLSTQVLTVVSPKFTPQHTGDIP